MDASEDIRMPIGQRLVGYFQQKNNPSPRPKTGGDQFAWAAPLRAVSSSMRIDMNKSLTNNILCAGLLASLTMLLPACSSNSSTDDAESAEDTENMDSTEGTQSLGLPADLSLVMLNSSTGDYKQFDTNTGELTDLNAVAQSSEDSAIQALEITDTSAIGYFFAWPDFREVNEEEALDSKYLLMNPSYVSGNTISSENFSQLAHFHDDTLAAHTAAEFENPEPGSGKAAGLERLNAHVTSQADLESEVADVIPAGETLCQAFIDPFVAFEMEHEEHEEEHEHGDLVHMALTTTGKIHFYVEGETGLESLQGFVQLDDVSSISDCNRATVAHASEDGALFFIPDTQTVYLVDSHGGDYHQHSRWDVSDILGEGGSADMMAVLGGGAEHDHDDE